MLFLFAYKKQKRRSFGPPRLCHRFITNVARFLPAAIIEYVRLSTRSENSRRLLLYNFNPDPTPTRRCDQGEGVVDHRVRVVKTHYPERMGYREFEGNKAILLVRNPFDAIDSYFNMALTNTHDQRYICNNV